MPIHYTSYYIHWRLVAGILRPGAVALRRAVAGAGDHVAELGHRPDPTSLPARAAGRYTGRSRPDGGVHGGWARIGVCHRAGGAGDAAVEPCGRCRILTAGA